VEEGRERHARELGEEEEEERARAEAREREQRALAMDEEKEKEEDEPWGWNKGEGKSKPRGRGSRTRIEEAEGQGERREGDSESGEDWMDHQLNFEKDLNPIVDLNTIEQYTYDDPLVLRKATEEDIMYNLHQKKLRAQKNMETW
jgi:hypothetical protein